MSGTDPNRLKRAIRHEDYLKEAKRPSVSYTPVRYSHAAIPLIQAFYDDVLLRMRLAEVCLAVDHSFVYPLFTLV